ncbi:outer membrane beta-barrel family protein [Pedobacter frigoris]|uniref:outer membrane beta-barrel family protein n=1 Tax=Pedobacter frigoris TaxID=2571272 RepID=UPI00292F317F|nr:outer membrane beta-barrel family protein [Pedobacter frigoris]
MKLIALTTLLMCCAILSFAQKPYAIKGAVTDTMATYKLVNTSVTILNQKDSTLVKFARANDEGHFAINNLKAGRFILLLTYPGYADYTEEFSLDSINPVKDFGDIDLILKSNLLEGIIIKGKVAAIKIKGDTTEFNAGSYVIQPNSKVEDLLKQLPGITVDKDGKITAQGQTVNKVLVDGEEFFGDDPTLVTKNIRGDMVDKVQLYDKKSDQATFTGIDDGEKTKTINIKLKEDKKNGYFGKIDLAGGTDKFYQGQAMFNHFKGKQRISAYGIFGNTGQTGLGWGDASKYGGSNGMDFSMDGGMIFSFGGGDDFDSFDGRYNGQGIPSANSGGFHYEDKWDNDKHALNTNYKLGSIGVKGNRNNQSLNNLPSGDLFNTSDQNFDNMMFRQKLDATYTLKLDSTATLKISVDGTLKNSKTKDSYNSSSKGNGNNLLNTGERDLDNESDQQLFNASAFYSKRLKKKGRTISVIMREAINKNDTEGYLTSENIYYNRLIPGQIDSTVNIDQFKTNNSLSHSLNTSMTYTEPISKKIALTLNYGLNINNSSSDRKSFNKTGEEYNNFDPKFSNDFQLNQLSNQVGATLSYTHEKINIRLGSNATNVNFKQFDAYTNKTYKRTFINWNPNASFNYRLKQQEGININYYGYTSQPTIDQIQPIRENTDPQNIRLGNPDLKPSFSNGFRLNYNLYKILSEQSIWASAGYNFTANPITSNRITDPETGNSTYQSINLNRNQASFNFAFNGEKKIKSIGLGIGLDAGVSGNQNYGMINNVVNTTNTYNYTGNLSVSKYVEKKYSFRISGGPRYSDTRSSLQTGTTNRGWGFDANGNLSIYLPAKIEFSTDGNLQYTGKTQTFNEDFKRIIWNASISKKFFKTENLKASISGNDLLNQNVGFSRYASANMQSQNSYTTIQRYFLFSLVWDFNKMGGAPTK